jgi:hypothetical protein
MNFWYRWTRRFCNGTLWFRLLFNWTLPVLCLRDVAKLKGLLFTSQREFFPSGTERDPPGQR